MVTEQKIADDSIEQFFIKSNFKKIVGIDEAGRGPGAGPVYSAAVHIPICKYELFLGKINDSKKLSAKKREELYDLIMEHCEVHYSSVTNKIIDKINILQATRKSMLNAVKKFKDVDLLIIDGNIHLDTDITQKSIIDGDQKSISIAAASIIAKVSRDRVMKQLHKKFPAYNWKNNKGYLTAEHIEAIVKFGVTKFHRLSFKKVGK